MNAPNTQKYWPKVLALAAELGVEPGVHVVDVLHDDWCSILKGEGFCDCDPDVAFRDDPRKKKK